MSASLRTASHLAASATLAKWCEKDCGFWNSAKREDKAKLEWLRDAAREGFDAIERGDYVALNSREEIRTFLGEIHEEVSVEVAAERKGG